MFANGSATRRRDSHFANQISHKLVESATVSRLMVFHNPFGNLSSLLLEHKQRRRELKQILYGILYILCVEIKKNKCMTPQRPQKSNLMRASLGVSILVISK